MGYTDNYKRNTYGIIAFWMRNNFEHSEFFDREISHHEMELARENHQIMQALRILYQQAELECDDIRTLIYQCQHTVSRFHDLLVRTMDRALHCDVIISTPTSLLDHMIREAEEGQRVFRLIESGTRIPPADATMHERVFWLRQMADHLAFIYHYVDASSYQLHEEVHKKTQKFQNLFLQANALNTIIRKPRNEMLPVQNSFNQMIIKEAKELESFKLELDELIKHCAAITTAPPNLLEHIAREAHHLWRNLEEQVVS